MEHAQLISIREFARRLKISDTAVHKAIKAGKISAACLDYTNPKRPKINPAAALAEWGTNYTPTYDQSESLSTAIEKGDSPILKPSPRKKTTPVEIVVDDFDDEEKSTDDETGKVDFSAEPEPAETSDENNDHIRLSKRATQKEAKRVDAIAIARINIIKLQEARGRLVPKDKVYREFFDVGVRVRSALQGIPDKWIDLILATNTRSEAHAMLYSAITEALEALTNPENL